MKLFLIALILGFGVGMWFGVNIGKGNALYDNPFSDPDIVEDAHDSADDVGLIDKGEEMLEKGKESLKEKAEELLD